MPEAFIPPKGVGKWRTFSEFTQIMPASIPCAIRKARPIGIQEALAWTAIWIAVALAFNLLVFFLYERNWFGWTDIASHDLTGRQAALQFFTGYVVEKSLSVDNIFVIAMIFAYLRVPLAQQHRLLIWGVVGAVILRGGKEAECLEVARMMSRNHPLMVKRYKDLIDRGGMTTYREGLAMEEASEATFYKSLTDVEATLRDGAEKFRAMVRWVAGR